MNHKSKVPRVIKAWVLLDNRGKIARVSPDNWYFFHGIFFTKGDVEGYEIKGETRLCRAEITFLPSKKQTGTKKSKRTK